MACSARRAGAQVINFDSLSAEPGVSGFTDLSVANGGSSTVSGVIFDSGFSVVGDQFLESGAAAPDYFARTNSGHYALTGNTYNGSDFFSNTYTGLNLTTTQVLTGLYVGYDDNGDGSNDADSVSITALGAGGSLGTVSASLNRTLTLLDTSSFASLAGITGYNLSTAASNDLYAAAGQSYLVADDLTFASPLTSAGSTPEPGAFGMVASLAFAGCFTTMRRRSGKAVPAKA